MKNNHTDINFAKIMNNFFRQYNLQHRLNVMIFDNVVSNDTLFFELIKNMIITSDYVNVTNNETNVKKIENYTRVVFDIYVTIEAADFFEKRSNQFH